MAWAAAAASRELLPQLGRGGSPAYPWLLPSPWSMQPWPCLVVAASVMAAAAPDGPGCHHAGHCREVTGRRWPATPQPWGLLQWGWAGLPSDAGAVQSGRERPQGRAGLGAVRHSHVDCRGQAWGVELGPCFSDQGWEVGAVPASGTWPVVQQLHPPLRGCLVPVPPEEALCGTTSLGSALPWVTAEPDTPEGWDQGLQPTIRSILGCLGAPKQYGKLLAMLPMP